MVVKNPQMEVSEVMWVPRSHPSHLDLVLKPMVTWMPHFQNPPHNKGFRIVFAFFSDQVLDFLFWLSFLVPFALYLQLFGTRICNVAWYLLHFDHVCLPFCMIFATFWHFNLSFARYLLDFGTSVGFLIFS